MWQRCGGRGGLYAASQSGRRGQSLIGRRLRLLVGPCGQFWGVHLAPISHFTHLPVQNTLGLGTGHHFGGSCVSISLSPFLPEPCSSWLYVSLLTRQLVQPLPFLPEGQGGNRQTNVTSETGLKVFSQRPQAHFFRLCLQSAKAAIWISKALSRGAAELFIAHNEFVMWGFFGLKDALMTSLALPASLASAQRPESLFVCLLLGKKADGVCEHLGTQNSLAGSSAMAVCFDL